MIRHLKKIRKFISKHILKVIIDYKSFKYISLYLHVFSAERYRTLFRLMQKGYLNIAYMHIGNYTYKEKEKLLIERILSMKYIIKHKFNITRKKYSSISEVSVLFVTHNSLPYEKAGYAIRTHHTVRHLQKNNFNICVSTRAGYPWDLQKYRDIKCRPMCECIDGIDYIRIEDKNKNFKQGTDSNYIEEYGEMLKLIIKERKITILHAHSNYMNGLSAIHAANKLALPVIYEMRGLWHFTRVTLDSQYKYEGMFAYEQEMEIAAAKAADKVVTLSKALKKLLMTWGIESDKIEVIPNSVDAHFFRPIKTNKNLFKKYNLHNKIVLGFVGSLTGYEGLKELIIATDNMIAEGMNLVLFIVGEGREKEKLIQLAKSKNIIFTGRVPFEEVSQYYSIFDICPFPRNSFEVCQYIPPLKVLEAMAMQKAIIVSDVDPLMEIITDNVNGLICKADDIKSLEKSIYYLCNNIKTRNNLAQNAREWVIENRSWDLAVEKYLVVYNTFLSA